MWNFKISKIPANVDLDDLTDETGKVVATVNDAHKVLTKYGIALWSKNLTFENVKITNTTTYTGIIGQSSGTTVLENVDITSGSISGGTSVGATSYSYVGGLIGYTNGTTKITNSTKATPI